MEKKHHNYKHGFSSIEHRCPLYSVWGHIKERCYKPNSKNYKNYGNRGIKVCDEWLKDFQSFYDWSLANGWKKGLTIDRIDNNGNYEPDNCRIVSRATNNRNSRQTKLNWDKVFEIRFRYSLGKYTQKELGRIFGITQAGISAVIKNKNWVEADGY